MSVVNAKPVTAEPVEARASELSDRFEGRPAREIVAAALTEEFPGRVALTSSFGAEAAVMLHLVAEVDPSTPVLFLDTRKLFGETLRYRDRLMDRLGLTDVRSLAPDPEEEAARDPDGLLFKRDADACCGFRKVKVLDRAIQPFDAWLTGRKRGQTGHRASLPVFEAAGARMKVNPLVDWSPDDVEDYLDAHDLPRHPLVEDGFLSIGCMPCTDRVDPGEDPRAGRWRGQGKTECGIHLPFQGADI